MCGLTWSLFNRLEEAAARPVSNLQYGLSTLHCWIRAFECLLHLSYRLPQPEGKISKEQLEARKKVVQKEFKERMGLRVDEPLPSGGNSNDGNVARRAFRSPEQFAACTGVDKQLIRDLLVVLQAVSCFYPLKPAALQAFCRRVAQRYVDLYSWRPMNTTLHKLLRHSAAVVEHCMLPLGMMSEEAAEATHKRVRQYRLRHTRKDSRSHTMWDLMSYLLVASDPLLSSFGVQRRRGLYVSRHGLLPETLALLADPELPEREAADSDDWGGTTSDNGDSNSESGDTSSNSDDSE